MDTQQEAVIKEMLMQGADRHTARRELVSRGVTTDGFEAAYEQLSSSYGLSSYETQPSEVSLTHKPKRSSASVGELLVGLLVLLFVCAAGISLALYGTYLHNPWSEMTNERTDKSLQFGDTIAQSKVDATHASVQLYKARMLDYQGVCTSVAVVAPIVCLENTVSAVVYAPVGEGGLYCKDGEGGVGSMVDTSGPVYLCK
jgi:hypothetical protein